MTEPAAPVPPAVPSATRNPTAMILGVVGAALIVVGAFVDWVSNIPDTAGLDAPIAVFWSTDLTGEATFINSGGFVLIVIALITLIGAVASRGGVLMLGGVLGVIAYALLLITLLRFPGVEVGIGDIGLGLWAVLLGGILAIVGGAMSRRPAVR